MHLVNIVYLPTLTHSYYTVVHLSSVSVEKKYQRRKAKVFDWLAAHSSKTQLSMPFSLSL